MDKLNTDIRSNLAREHSSSHWILSDLLAAPQKEIQVLESGFQDPYTTDFKGSTTAAFQVGVKDTRDRSITLLFLLVIRS